MRRFVIAIHLTLCCAAADAHIWDEVVRGGGDAPALMPGQPVFGEGPLLQIDGTIAGGSGANADWVDLYQIQITDEANFSATTVFLGSGNLGDTQLWLFDAAGNGISHNDNAPGLGVKSRLTSINVPSNGVYFLAVTGWNLDALNAAGQLIWIDTGFTVPSPELPPDGPGAPGPLGMWPTSGGATGRYRVMLTGAEEIEHCHHPCDTNCDGLENPIDIPSFVDLLLAPAPLTPCSPCAGDTNDDGSVNGGDIQAFVSCLIP